MAVPMKKQLYRPILEIVAEIGGNVHRQKIRELLIQGLALKEDDLEDRSRSGSRRFNDRTSWAMHDLRGCRFPVVARAGIPADYPTRTYISRNAQRDHSRKIH